jgi:hypothetical protein
MTWFPASLILYGDGEGKTIKGFIFLIVGTFTLWSGFFSIFTFTVIFFAATFRPPFLVLLGLTTYIHNNWNIHGRLFRNHNAISYRGLKFGPVRGDDSARSFIGSRRDIREKVLR